MRNLFRKAVAAISAAALLTAALPVSEAFAADTNEIEITLEQDNEIYTAKGSVEGQSFFYRVVDEGAIIVGFEGDPKNGVVTLPSEVVDMPVVGVEDFVFGGVSGKVSFVVPDTLMLEYIGSEAFMTSAVDLPIKEGTTINGVVKMLTNDIAGLNYSDEEIAEAAARAYSRIADITAYGTIEQIAFAIVKEIRAGTCGFSQQSIDNLNFALSALSYKNVLIKTSSEKSADKIDILFYARQKRDLNCDVYVPSENIMGDTNQNGKLDLMDAILIAKFLVGAALSGEQQLSGDYNRNGKVDLQDAIGVAKELLK